MAKPKPQIDTSWMVSGALCWLELDHDPMYLPASIVSLDKKTLIVTILMATGGNQQVKASLLLERAEPQQKTQFSNGFEDMVNMETLNDAELLQNLSLRFTIDNIFTYVGPTLLVLNPFKKIKGVTEPEVRDKYVQHIIKNNRNYKDLDPHVYALGAQAYRNLFDNEKNQAIVISGESGAGKTENAKFAMNLLTSIASDQIQQGAASIEDQILGCNPILESFGNAKTTRNNNSSRFGKYVRIIVDADTKKIKGAEIINYLLEKSRINQQGKNERNFHIFYIFLKGMSPEQLIQYKLDKPIEQFHYLNSSNTYTIPNVDDGAQFAEITECFQVLGMADDISNIIGIVATVLLLGNLQFDGSTITDTSPAKLIDGDSICELLQLDAETLQRALTMKSRTVGKQVINSPLTIEECQFTRDTLSKDLYDKLFNWLVEKLNIAIKPTTEMKVAVGLLDIYGFEVFDKNGFEQIMINYTNEKLHQLYIQYVFKEEERIFIDEGLQQFCSSIDFEDNTQVIELIDKQPGGVFSLLDESCQVKSSDDALLQKIRQAHKQNGLLKNPKMPSDPSFVIVHTAKDVAYTVTGFREKNKDEMSSMTAQSIAKSTNTLVQYLYKPGEQLQKDKFISQKIKKEMAELMTELNSCDVHFVRCIKPNDSKKPNELWPDMTLKQIRYLGVLDSLKVRKESYSIRRLYQSFYKRYGGMTRNKIYPVLIKENANFRQLVIDMFKDYMPQLDHKMVLFGNTRVFIRQQGMPVIDETYLRLLEEKQKKAARLQKAWNVHKLNKKMRVLLGVALRLKGLAQRVKIRTKQKKMNRTANFIQIWWRFKLRQMRVKKYREASLNFQIYIKRYYQMQLSTRKKVAVPILQRFVRQIIRCKEQRKQREIQQTFDYIFEQSWLVVQAKQATKIQAQFRGYIQRKKSKQLVNKIKLAGRMIKLDSSIKKIQHAAKKYIATQYLRRARNAVRYIQGYMRMRWLSALFKQMRRAVMIIQKQARIYIRKQVQFRQQYEQFIKPWESDIQQQRVDASTFWLMTNEDQEDCQPILEQCLVLWRPRLPKICLFSVPIDIDVLSDLYQSYNPNYSYARTLLNIIIQQLRKDHPVQSYHVTEESTFCVTMGGTSIFEFGDGQLFMNADQSDQVEKIIFPDIIKAKSISCGDEHMLVTTADGTLLQFGDTSKAIRFKPLVHTIYSQMTSQNYVVNTDGKLYNWIGVRFHMPIQHRVRTVSTGSQFAVALCDGGQLYSWGENVEGELGLGDTIYRTEPTLVNIEKVQQVSCGLKHVVCRVRNRYYTWGWGERGQLGHSEFRNELSPRVHNVAVLWVSCGRTITSVITNDRIVMQCGTNQSISYQCKFEQVKLNVSLHTMIPIRVISTWSKVVEITYITFANTVSCLEQNINKKLKIINSLINLWSESTDPQSIDPPFNQAISNYLYEASMRKSASNCKSSINAHYKTHREMLYIDDDRQWAMKKRQLVDNINKHQQSISVQDKLRTIKQRYIALSNQHQLSQQDEMFLKSINNNQKLLEVLDNISL